MHPDPIPPLPEPSLEDRRRVVDLQYSAEALAPYLWPIFRPLVAEIIAEALKPPAPSRLTPRFIRTEKGPGPMADTQEVYTFDPPANYDASLSYEVGFVLTLPEGGELNRNAEVYTPEAEFAFPTGATVAASLTAIDQHGHRSDPGPTPPFVAEAPEGPLETPGPLTPRHVRTEPVTPS